MRRISAFTRSRAALIAGATVAITGALAAPSFAISVALHHSSGSASSSTGSSVDVLWTVGVLAVVFFVVAAVAFLPRPRIRLGSVAVRDVRSHAQQH